MPTHDVFISYSRLDEESAHALRVMLEGFGTRCWMDVRSASAGCALSDELNGAIRSAERFVFLASRHSLRAAWPRRELGIAWDEEQRRIEAGETSERQVVLVLLDDALLDRQTFKSADDAWLRNRLAVNTPGKLEQAARRIAALPKVMRELHCVASPSSPIDSS